MRSAQLRSGCLTVFFSRLLALANQLETCERECGSVRADRRRVRTRQMETQACVLISKRFHVQRRLLMKGPLPAIRIIHKERELEAEDGGRVGLQGGSLKPKL